MICLFSDPLNDAITSASQFAVCTDNVVIMPDYYARRMLTFILGERDPLLQAFRKRKASDDLEVEPKA